MLYSDILKNDNFQDIAACIRSVHYSDDKSYSLFPTALNQLVEVTWPYHPDEWLDRFVDLQMVMLEKHQVSLSTDNLDWLTGQLGTERPDAIVSLLLAYATAPEETLTPVEIAEMTGTAESGWRNKAAAGLLPGAMKKGKQWLIPKRYATTE